MSKDAESDQRILRHLLSFLDRNEDKNESVEGKLKSIWDSETESVGKLKIRHCLVEMLELPVDVLRIAKDLEPYKDDAIPVLIEALNLKRPGEAFMFSNARDVLEIIGDDRAIPPILDKFDEHLKEFYVTGLLTKIGLRGTDETRALIINHLTTYLSVDRKVDRLWMGKYEKDIENIIDALRILGPIKDLRVPAILERHIARTPYDSDVCQKALLALASMDEARAVSSLTRKIESAQINIDNQSKKHMRIVSNDREDTSDQAYLTICVRENNQSELEELAYTFKYENGLVYFLNQGREDGSFKLIAGAASNKNNAINTSMLYLETFLPEMKFVPEKYRECNQILSRHFNFETQGFFQSQIFSRAYPLIIYDSQWCRVKFAFNSSGDRYDFSTHLHVYYGRLHAPSNSEQNFMIWNGEKRWCWHRVDYALNFLDGLSPEEAVKVEYQPRLIDEYRRSDLAQKLSGVCQAEWMAGMESEVWKYYGQRLFELFDIRRSDLWEKYNEFIQEFYKIKGSSNLYGGYYPLREKIC